MLFFIFVSILAGALLSAIGFIYFLIRNKKYGKKPALISILICIVLLGISIPLSQQNAYSYSDYKKQSSAYSFDKYLQGNVEMGTFVKIEGEVSSLGTNAIGEEEQFILESKDGIFEVENGTGEMIRDGELLILYGGYIGNGENNTPTVNAQYIDR